MVEVGKLQELFVDETSMRDFQERYLAAYKGDHEIECFGWDAVADDIYNTLGSYILEIGRFPEIEIGSFYTNSGNPELIEVGELVGMPVPDPDQVNDPDYNDETGFIGDYVGNYEFK